MWVLNIGYDSYLSSPYSEDRMIIKYPSVGSKDIDGFLKMYFLFLFYNIYFSSGLKKPFKVIKSKMSEGEKLLNNIYKKKVCKSPTIKSKNYNYNFIVIFKNR